MAKSTALGTLAARGVYRATLMCRWSWEKSSPQRWNQQAAALRTETGSVWLPISRTSHNSRLILSIPHDPLLSGQGVSRVALILPARGQACSQGWRVRHLLLPRSVTHPRPQPLVSGSSVLLSELLQTCRSFSRRVCEIHLSLQLEFALKL